jgi:ATP-dependent DNA helicase RecG
MSLVVIDEQHKFSVDQRHALVGAETHLIEASATPIPRSLAIALFGGWQEARIGGQPVDKLIHSYLLSESDGRGQSSRLLLDAIRAGKKAIVLYPSVTGSDKSVTEAAARLEGVLAGKVTALHGRLSSKDKEQAFALFRTGERPVLVASTAVEVGVDVPDVACLVVCEAQRFGVSQLHQIRGRLVRNGGLGHFIMLVPDKRPKKDTMERLEAVRDVSDGFDLAERDLELRGFGDVLGEAQTGASLTLFRLTRLGPGDFLV